MDEQQHILEMCFSPFILLPVGTGIFCGHHRIGLSSLYLMATVAGVSVVIVCHIWSPKRLLSSMAWAMAIAMAMARSVLKAILFQIR